MLALSLFLWDITLPTLHCSRHGAFGCGSVVGTALLSYHLCSKSREVGRARSYLCHLASQIRDQDSDQDGIFFCPRILDPNPNHHVDSWRPTLYSSIRRAEHYSINTLNLADHDRTTNHHEDPTNNIIHRNTTLFLHTQ